MMLAIRRRSGRTTRLVALVTAVIAAVVMACAAVASSASADSYSSLIYDFHGPGAPVASASLPASAVEDYAISNQFLSNGFPIKMICWTSVSGSFNYPLNYSTQKVFKVALGGTSTQDWVNASFVYYQENVPAC